MQKILHLLIVLLISLSWHGRIFSQVGIGTTTPTAELEVAGWIGRTAHNNGAFVGSYDNVANNATFTNPIYVIGSNYKPLASSLSNMYGLGYTHTSSSFITAGTGAGWGTYIAADGDARIWLGATIGGNSYFNTGGNFGINEPSPGLPLDVKRTNANTDNIWNVAYFVAKKTSAIGDGFGTGIRFRIEDHLGNKNSIATISAVRNGADNTGTLQFGTYSGGALTERMFILPSGNVGIGTNNPTENLEISSSTGTEIMLTATGSESFTRLRMQNDDITYGLIVNSSENFGLYDYTASAYRMSIASNGNVGIGNTSPSTKLHVTGSVRFASNGEGANRILVSDATGVATWQDASEINTNSWQLDGNASTTPGTDFIGTVDANDLVFKTNNSEEMRILSNGDIGIGTSAPTSNLHLSDNMSRSSDEAFLITDNTAAGGYLKLKDYSNIASNFVPLIHGKGLGSGNDRNGVMIWGEVGEDNTDDVGIVLDGRNVASALSNANILEVRNFETKHIVVAPNGYMGINETLPGMPLDVKRTGASTNGVWLAAYFESKKTSALGDGFGTGVRFRVEDDLGAKNSIAEISAVRSGADNSGMLQFGTYTGGVLVRRLFIMPSGDVGIGTSAPGGQFELSLNEGRKPGSGSWTVTSDERLKNITGNYTKGLDELAHLEPIVYKYKNVGNRIFDERVLETEFVGFTAQNIQEVFPEAVGLDEDGYLNLDMQAVLVAYLNAIKELKERNEMLMRRMESLERQE